MLTKCATCGKKIYLSPSHKRVNNYCSRECVSVSQRNGRVSACPICGREKYFPLSRFKNQLPCCSWECSRVLSSQKIKGQKRPDAGLHPLNNKLRISVQCKICGKLAKIHLHQYLSGRQFCSHKCYWIDKKGEAKRIKCKNCGKILTSTLTKHPLFCNRECYHTYQRNQIELVEFKCAFCGKEKSLEKKRDRAYSRWENGKPVVKKYCSKECADKAREGTYGEGVGNWRGGKTSLQDSIRKSSWYIQCRRQCFERDGFKSILSGNNGRLRHHHLTSYSILFDQFSITKNNWRSHKDILFNLGNIVTLTEKEHKKFHHIYGKVTTPEQFEEFKQSYFANHFQQLAC